MIRQMVVCTMIKHTLIFKFTDGNIFGVVIKVKIKIIQYVCIHYITQVEELRISTEGLTTKEDNRQG